MILDIQYEVPCSFTLSTFIRITRVKCDFNVRRSIFTKMVTIEFLSHSNILDFTQFLGKLNTVTKTQNRGRDQFKSHLIQIALRLYLKNNKKYMYNVTLKHYHKVYVILDED